MAVTKCKDLSTFWFVCATISVLSWIFFAIILFLMVNDVLNFQFFFAVGFTVMIIGCFTLVLAVEHFRNSRKIGFDVWTWSLLLITTFECWALLSMVLNAICYILAINDLFIASPGDGTGDYWFRFIANIGIYGFLLSLHIYIILNVPNVCFFVLYFSSSLKV